MKMPTLPLAQLGEGDGAAAAALAVDVVGRLLAAADLLDRLEQVAVPVEGVPGQVEVRVEDQHGGALGGRGQCIGAGAKSELADGGRRVTVERIATGPGRCGRPRPSSRPRPATAPDGNWQVNRYPAVVFSTWKPVTPAASSRRSTIDQSTGSLSATSFGVPSPSSSGVGMRTAGGRSSLCPRATSFGAASRTDGSRGGT